MTNTTEQRLPPELIPGNMGEIQERSQKRQERWAKKLEELHSLRTPPATAQAFPWAVALASALAGAGVVGTLTWVL